MSGPVERYDAVVVGGTIRGLVAAYLLGALGHRTILVESSPRLGGADGSFETPTGDLFDHGFHVLDEDRSELTTRLFRRALGGRVRRVVLRRGIVLRGHVLPYAPGSDELPPELRSLVHDGQLVDDIGSGRPSRDRLARCYGRGFADLLYDEVLASYPTESRHLRFGVAEERLLTNLYPWFCPRAERPIVDPDESRAFHDRLRTGRPQAILYPADGGFGRFAEGLADACDPSLVEVVTGAGDVEPEVVPGTRRFAGVRWADRRVEADRYFWGTSWPRLCGLLDVPCQDVATDRVVLGSYRLDRPAATEFHEILVGDPRYRINRVHVPSAIRGTDDALLQVEFAFPIHEEAWSSDADEWLSCWVGDLRSLGLLTAGHQVLEADFRSFVLHFNGFGAEGEELVDADPVLLGDDTNVVPLAPSMANLNLNRSVPRVVRDVVAAL